MINLNYNEWYINQKRPDEASQEYKDFYKFHKEVCTEGCYVGGEFITPFLYWHLNFWKTDITVMGPSGKMREQYANPYLRDNEWVVCNEIYRAEQEHKGLVILGIRRFAKSVIEASYIGWGATLFENSQNVLVGLNSADIKLITDKLDKGLNALPAAWHWGRIEDNWNRQVTLGIKKRDGTRIPFSYIMVRNLDDGNREEAIAGTKPSKLIIDEIGKGPFLNGFQAAIPGFTSEYGWICSPILTGTGGDMTKFMDAKSLFFDTDSFNFMTYQSEDNSKRVHGLFLSYKYRMEAKVDSTLGDYLNNSSPALKEIPMKVSDIEKALKITDETLAKRKKAGDRLAYLKEKMYYPKEVDDIFLNENTNIFDIEAAKAQQSRIRVIGRSGQPIVLFHDGERVKHNFTDKLPITNFPHKGSDNKDAPIVVWEFPISEVPPYGLYVAGVDPYRQGKAKYSESLGAVYIYKRMHEINSEKFQDMFVASYVARPDKKEVWEEQARLLIKYYNARTLCENDDISFIEYMKAKGDQMYLERQPEWLREIVPNTTVQREYGIHRSAEKIIEYMHVCLKRYTETVYEKMTDERGSVIKEVTGFSKILDMMLLEEITQYNEEGNFDRLVAAELAIAQAMKMDPIFGKVSGEMSDPRYKELFNKNKPASRNIFGDTATTPIYGGKPKGGGFKLF